MLKNSLKMKLIKEELIGWPHESHYKAIRQRASQLDALKLLDVQRHISRINTTFTMHSREHVEDHYIACKAVLTFLKHSDL